MKNKSFTLAETLITLVIIGIIAVLTIPTLYSKYQKHIWSTQLHLAYNRIVQGSQAIAGEIGDINYYPDYTEPEKFPSFYEQITESFARGSGGTYCPGNKLNGDGRIYYVYPKCKYSSTKSYPNDTYKGLDGGQPWSGYKLNLTNFPHNNGHLFTYPDGMAISIRFVNCSGNVSWHMVDEKISHMFFIDLNGPKEPNITGRDIFLVVQYKDKNAPVPYGFDNYYDCNTSGAGLTCAGRIMADGWKMNY